MDGDNPDTAGRQGDLASDRAQAELAAAAWRRGELVLLPTETVYGLAADAGNAEAVAKIFAAKGRPRFNPLIAHVGDVALADNLAVFDDAARALAAAFWPGPLTLVLPVRPGGGVSDLARAGLETVALRQPAHPLALAALQAFGGPVAAPSANRSGRPSPTTFKDALDETGDACAARLDGGDCRVGLESTVVGLFGGRARLLRPGGVTRAQIEAVIGPLAAPEADDGARSPGRLTRHYAPRAPVRLDADAAQAGEVYLSFGRPAAGPDEIALSATGDLTEAAARLFSALRTADAQEPSAIAVAPIPEAGLGEAINDRLRRAAGFVG